MNKTLAFFRFVIQNEWYINCIPGSVDELPHALVPLPENLPRVFDEERNPLFFSLASETFIPLDFLLHALHY